MKIFITGSSGFIGSHITSDLHNKPNTNLLLSQHSKNIDNIINSNNVTITSSNLCKQRGLYKDLLLFKPDMIIHFAGSNFIPLTEKNPAKTFINNVFLTHNLINILEEIKPKYFIFASTAGLYRSSKRENNEKCKVLANNTYLKTKYLCEFILKHSLPSTKKIVLRISNVYGKGCEKPFIVHKLCQSISMRNFPIKLGNISLIRDYIYIEDVANAISSLLNSLDKVSQYFSIYNISSGKSYSVRQLIDMTTKYTNKYPTVIDDTYFRYRDKKELYISSKKFQKEFSWKPLMNIEKYFQDYFTILNKKYHEV